MPVDRYKPSYLPDESINSRKKLGKAHDSVRIPVRDRSSSDSFARTGISSEYVTHKYNSGLHDLYSVIPEFLSYSVLQFLRPVWSSVEKRPSTRQLDQLCTFPIVPVPTSLDEYSGKLGSSFLMRYTSGEWCVVRGSRVVTQIAPQLEKIIYAANEWRDQCRSSSLHFDPTGQCYFVQHDFANDAVVVHRYDPDAGQFIPLVTVDGLPPGAFNCIDVSASALLFAIGPRLVRFQITERTIDVVLDRKERVMKHEKFQQSAPVSPVTMFYDSGRQNLFFLDEGNLYINGNRIMIRASRSLLYVSIAGTKDTLVVLGYDPINNMYSITLVDLVGLHVISRTKINTPNVKLSIVTLCVVSDQVILAGKSGRSCHLNVYQPIHL
jgi:hypothetical protein